MIEDTKLNLAILLAMTKLIQILRDATRMMAPCAKTRLQIEPRESNKC
jgi:hypothetical protein